MKLPLTVTWQSYDSITPDTPGFNLSDLGGLDNIYKDWAAYVAQYATEWHPHLEAIRQSIIANKVWAGGDWHQNTAHGVPVLSDGHFMVCSWRAWGGLLAAVWNAELRQQFTCIDFYMDGRLPEQPAVSA